MKRINCPDRPERGPCEKPIKRETIEHPDEAPLVVPVTEPAKEPVKVPVRIPATAQ